MLGMRNSSESKCQATWRGREPQVLCCRHGQKLVYLSILGDGHQSMAIDSLRSSAFLSFLGAF